MDTSSLISSILTSLWVISTGLAVQFRASSKAQRKTLRYLRDRDIAWAIYVHQLRITYATETGKKFPDCPPILISEPEEELTF